MAPSLSLLIGLRFSRGRRRSGMVSLISVISTVGIALGVAVLIVGLSAMNGFERELNNRILAVVPHGEIEAVNQPWNHWQSVLPKVEAVRGIEAAAPYINFTGLVESGSNLRAIQVKGVDPQQETRLSALPRFVQADAWANEVSANGGRVFSSQDAQDWNDYVSLSKSLKDTDPVPADAEKLQYYQEKFKDITPDHVPVRFGDRIGMVPSKVAQALKIHEGKKQIEAEIKRKKKKKDTQIHMDYRKIYNGYDENVIFQQRRLDGLIKEGTELKSAHHGRRTIMLCVDTASKCALTPA